jgi:DNA-binding winged helix-turn-helix (wHTH) protein/predicted Zn-dependent protease
MNRPEGARWKFGLLEFDTAQRLLFRGDELAPLSRKAAEILAVLVENQGQLVEKEYLMRRVWPDSFVEESNLAVHISQLRKTLAEEGGDCRIETIPRRGYRLTGTLERVDARSAPPPEAANLEMEGVQSAPGAGMEEGPIQGAVGLPDGTGARSRGRRMAGWAAAGLAFGVAAVILAVGLRIRQKGAQTPAANPAGGSGSEVSGPAGEKDRIVLGPFANSTGEAVFDVTVREAMMIELEQSPFLSLVSDERMGQSLRMMGKPAQTPLTPELSRELCQRNDGAAVVDGRIAQLGTQYVLGVRAVNCRTGDHLFDLQTTAAGKELVLKALGDLSGQLRTRLGESLSTVQKFDAPIEEATTSSLEALQAYSLGRETMVEKGESAECVPFFQRAIRLDPGFAIAYAALGNAYANLGETGSAAASIRKAYELSAHVGEHERLYIEAHYYQFVTGDLTKASRTYEVWSATFPNDEAPKTNLAAIYSDLGKFDRSLELAKEAVRIASHDGQSYANLANAYISMGKPDEVNAVAEQAISKNLDSSRLRLYLYDAAFLQQNSAGMQKQMAWASGEPGVEDAFLGDQADDLAASGQLARARELTGRAVTAARRDDEKETAAGYELDEALREAEFGNDAEARRAAEAALALATDRDSEYGAAVALALGGAEDRAESLARELDQEFPEDTLVQYLYLPAIRGAIAVRQKDSSRSLGALEAARPYELGVAGGLLPIYLRGLAYLEARDGAKAEVEFQKIVDHPGVVLNAPIGPLARLQMGRACLAQGKSEQAKAAYEDFLNRWMTGDADIPILREARAEYGKQWPASGVER